MELFSEVDSTGNTVREGFALSPYSILPEGHTWVPYTPNLTGLKVAKKATIKTWRDIACVQPVSVAVGGTNYLWDADKVSQDLLSSVVNLASLGVVSAPPIWRSENNTNVSVTLDDIKNIAAAIALQTQQAYARSWLLKYEVDQVTNTSDLDSITW